ncbi:MAG TPA: hypothetical protein VF177_20425 [Anaerolineae bacterium]
MARRRVHLCVTFWFGLALISFVTHYVAAGAGCLEQAATGCSALVEEASQQEPGTTSQSTTMLHAGFVLPAAGETAAGPVAAFVVFILIQPLALLFPPPLPLPPR